MMIAEAGFGVGRNASKNIVAGKSQRSIAALSIGGSPVRGRNPVQAACNYRRAPSGTIRGVDSVQRAWSDYLTVRYFLARFFGGVGAVSPEYSARIAPIPGSMVSPPCSATGNKVSTAIRHATASCSRNVERERGGKREFAKAFGISTSGNAAGFA